MPRDGRFRVALGLALGASLAFLDFLLARPVGAVAVQLVANLAQLLGRPWPRSAAPPRRPCSPSRAGPSGPPWPPGRCWTGP